MLKNCINTIAWILVAILVAGCGSSATPTTGTPSPTVTPLSELTVSFADPAMWDGIRVPLEGRCGLCGDGGGGSSPALIVSNIPAGANAVIVEFNDRSYGPLAADGGHGAIWVAVADQSEILVPSIPEQTVSLPDGVHIEHNHRAPKGKQGAYLGPCSCGTGNRYFAVVKAVYRSEQGETQVLGKGQIELGRF